MPHHYKKKQTGPISKKEKGGAKPKQPKQKRTQRKPQPPTKRKTVVKIEDRPGFFMKMGSKQKNTPSNFNERSAMLMNGDPKSGHYDMYGDYYKDAMNSLGQDQIENMNETYNEMKAGYQQPVELVSKNTSGSPEAYQSLGKGLANLLKPKSATAKANQKFRQDKREAKRKAQGGTKVGNFLRKTFKTGNQNPNL